MIVTKAIKPKRLKADEMRLALLSGMHKVGRATVKEYEKTVATWADKPTFEYLISLQQPGPTMIAGMGGGGEGAKHWRYVNEGTHGPYPIPKTGNATLKFQSGYNAKTTPGLISSTGGGPYGEIVYAKHVTHPGIKAREFDKTIQELIEPRFKDEMEDAMREAAKASGHEM